MVSTDYGKVDTSVDLKNKWSDNDIITLARDKDFIDSFDINNFDASSPNARNDERWNSQIVNKLRSGKWGWKPKTNELVNLEKSEAYKDGYKLISQISKERIRKALKINNSDDGFKSYKLSKSNLPILLNISFILFPYSSDLIALNTFSSIGSPVAKS
jgi:hypothetical protein